LHWNPVRLIQRFGRIDRIGSGYDVIYGFNFLPETGIERNLGLKEKLRNRIQEIHDILLLSRPDYTIFDEMRNTEDFKLFADMRLSGVGMIGIVHATNPIDAIQRFIGRVEMGVIPQVIDTVVFIKNGQIQKVLSLKMTVKVPSGMTEADLARPVVVVTDFETEKLMFQIEWIMIKVRKKREQLH